LSIINRISSKVLVTLGAQLERVRDGVAAATLPQFATPAPGLVIQLPRQVVNPQHISIGRDVKIGPNSVLKATVRYPGGWLSHPEGDHVAQEFEPQLVLGDRVTATWGLQVVAFSRIVIEDDVLMAGNVYISDGQHATTRGDRPYKYQGIDKVAPIRIGRGSWLAQNVVILPGVTVGRTASSQLAASWAATCRPTASLRARPRGSSGSGTPRRAPGRSRATWPGHESSAGAGQPAPLRARGVKGEQ